MDSDRSSDILTAIAYVVAVVISGLLMWGVISAIIAWLVMLTAGIVGWSWPFVVVWPAVFVGGFTLRLIKKAIS